MGDFARLAARSPNDEQSNSIEHTDALQPLFLIAMPRVLTREKISVEERLKVNEIDAVILDVTQTLGYVLCVHALQCICIMHM